MSNQSNGSIISRRGTRILVFSEIPEFPAEKKTLLLHEYIFTISTIIRTM
jgi:hypothetical protein